MKLALFTVVFVSLLPGEFLLSASADDEQENPCMQIFLACADKGYDYDKVAEPGQKLWADCADLIINKNQPVRGLTIDPLRLKACRNYKQAHERYESDWAAHHPMDTE